MRIAELLGFRFDFPGCSPSLPPRMTRKLIQWSAIFAIVFSIGAHWVVLQSFAWFGMAVSFSQTAPLKEALGKTFDGQHPCKLCDFVAKGKHQEKHESRQQQMSKLNLFCVERQLLFLGPQPFGVPTVRPSLLLSRLEAPPAPPPRRA